jgi:murein L,D-transpeptidase YcbB/YkuD
MKTHLLSAAAVAGSILLSAPGPATANAPAPAARAVAAPALWLQLGRATEGARALLEVLRRAPLDGLDSGPALAARAEGLIARSSAGDRSAAAEAERLLSTAWVRYVQTLERRAPGMDYADGRAAPRQDSPAQILKAAAAAPSLARHVERVSAVNPLYARLREAAWNEMLRTGAPDRRALASLERLRHMPRASRFIIVDAASAQLWMIEGGEIAGSMPVITGDSESPTPMVASTIYYATLNPYWNVPREFVRTKIAPNVVKQGLSYLTERDYEVLDGTRPIDPASVDWAAVATGAQTVKLRRKPGEWNSMGRMKFGFPNRFDIFLHDTPDRAKFAEADRNISMGCIRLSDAPRLGRWLLGREPVANSAEPEQHVALPAPVPIFVTYLTAHAQDGALAFVDDVYGIDSRGGTRVAASR